MNLDKYNLEDLLITAIKSEIDSKEFYMNTSKKTKNGLLQDKLTFLSKEEEKHRLFVEDIFKNHFPNKKIILPKTSPVPITELKKINENITLGGLLQEAMNAEKNASDFYNGLSKRFEKGSKLYNTLIYFSDMENGHYKILEIEKESMDRFEEADIYWPMVHVGP
jgi:rubrerythrin